MKGVIVTTKGDVTVQEYREPLYQTVGATVGGYIEHVKPMRLKRPYCMIVNENGHMLRLDANPVGCYLYQTDVHGYPILGDIVLMKDGYRDGEPDVIGLDDAEVVELSELARQILAQLAEQAQ